MASILRPGSTGRRLASTTAGRQPEIRTGVLSKKTGRLPSGRARRLRSNRRCRFAPCGSIPDARNIRANAPRRMTRRTAVLVNVGVSRSGSGWWLSASSPMSGVSRCGTARTYRRGRSHAGGLPSGDYYRGPAKCCDRRCRFGVGQDRLPCEMAGLCAIYLLSPLFVHSKRRHVSLKGLSGSGARSTRPRMA
jgi:hypothetical protein